jgi:hypothetical protein
MLDSKIRIGKTFFHAITEYIAYYSLDCIPGRSRRPRLTNTVSIPIAYHDKAPIQDRLTPTRWKLLKLCLLSGTVVS